jgi:hypothetical protein
MTNVPEKNTLAIVKIIAYDAPSGEKNRPAYIITTNGIVFRCYPITTKYHSKSEKIKSASFEILDWQYAGLHSPSWINVSEWYEMPVEKVTTKYIGVLSTEDKLRFAEFVSRRARSSTTKHQG